MGQDSSLQGQKGWRESSSFAELSFPTTGVAIEYASASTH